MQIVWSGAEIRTLKLSWSKYDDIVLGKKLNLGCSNAMNEWILKTQNLVNSTSKSSTSPSKNALWKRAVLLSISWPFW